MNVSIVSREDLLAVARSIREGVDNPLLAMILFSGERLYCCDEGVVARNEDGKVIGLATTAPHGEENSGEPTIVAIAVDVSYRRLGIASELLLSTVRRMKERGIICPYRVDVVTKAAKKFFDSVDDEMMSCLNVIDMSKYSLV